MAAFSLKTFRLFWTDFMLHLFLEMYYNGSKWSIFVTFYSPSLVINVFEMSRKVRKNVVPKYEITQLPGFRIFYICKIFDKMYHIT